MWLIWLKSIFTASTLDFLKSRWKPLFYFTAAFSAIIYIVSLNIEISNLKQSVRNERVLYNKAIDDWKKLTLLKSNEVAKLQSNISADALQISQEVKSRNEEIKNISTTNRDLVRRLSELTKANNNQSVPNNNTTSSSKPATSGESLVECATEVTELAEKADTLAIDQDALLKVIKNFNENVEKLNKE